MKLKKRVICGLPESKALFFLKATSKKPEQARFSSSFRAAFFLLLLAVLLLLAGGCTKQELKKALSSKNNQKPDEQELQNAIRLCKAICSEYSGSKEKGPCLSNNLLPGWVCDIAHNPRKEIDNLPENQCSAFRNGLASHFVELDAYCNFIRAY